VLARYANPVRFRPPRLASWCAVLKTNWSKHPSTTVTTPASTAALRSTATHSAAPQHDTLAAGDRVESLHARRPGRVVWVYPDGSACICWDDGEPQEAGLGHERMPRELLIRLDHDATVPDAAPANRPEEVPQSDAEPAPTAPLHPLKKGDLVVCPHDFRSGTVVKVYPDGSACVHWDESSEPEEGDLRHERMPRELLIKQDYDATAPTVTLARPWPALPPAAMADREAYCHALFTTLHQHADDDAIEDLCDHFEVMLDTLSARRPQSAMARRWKTLFERHYYPEGGV